MDDATWKRGWARARTGTGYALLVAAALFVVTALYTAVAVLIFHISGNAISGYKPEDLGWGDLGSVLVGSVTLVGLCLWGAAVLLADDDVASNDPPPAGEAELQEPQRFDPIETKGIASHRHTRASRAREAEIQHKFDQHHRDVQVRALIESNPDVGTAVLWMGRLLQEQADLNRLDMIAAERKDKRRDIILLTIGTILGVVAPVISAPALSALPQ